MGFPVGIALTLMAFLMKRLEGKGRESNDLDKAKKIRRGHRQRTLGLLAFLGLSAFYFLSVLMNIAWLAKVLAFTLYFWFALLSGVIFAFLAFLTLWLLIAAVRHHARGEP